MDMKNNGLQLNLIDEEETDSAIPEKQYDHTPLFERLAQSAFCSKFRLSAKDEANIQEKGMAIKRVRKRSSTACTEQAKENWCI